MRSGTLPAGQRAHSACPVCGALLIHLRVACSPVAAQLGSAGFVTKRLTKGERTKWTKKRHLKRAQICAPNRYNESTNEWRQ